MSSYDPRYTIVCKRCGAPQQPHGGLLRQRQVWCVLDWERELVGPANAPLARSASLADEVKRVDEGQRPHEHGQAGALRNPRLFGAFLTLSATVWGRAPVRACIFAIQENTNQIPPSGWPPPLQPPPRGSGRAVYWRRRRMLAPSSGVVAPAHWWAAELGRILVVSARDMSKTFTTSARSGS